MLAVEALCKRFGGFLAVNQVSFEVREGEILGLIGPNGSGKSTTFNLIAGTLRPTAGSFRFQENEIDPAVGRKVPAIRLKVVLLPEPFGPISPRISPSRTSKETWFTARNPPKRLQSASTASIRPARRRSTSLAAAGRDPAF